MNRQELKERYAVPEWMHQFLPLFNNTGGNNVEELLHDGSTTPFANVVRYLLIVSARSQFDILMALHKQDVLQTVTLKSDVVSEIKGYKWIEGNGDIPADVMSAAYETGAGKAICAVCEVNGELQRQGWPRLVWAYLDVDCAAMICRNTGKSISEYVQRWLPVDGSALLKEY